VKVLPQNSAQGVSRRLVGAALLSGFIGFAGAVQADPITAPTVDITFNGGLFPVGSVGTRITYNNQPDVSTTVDMTVAAGMFRGSASNPTGGFQLSSLYLSADNVLAYCVDILERLLTGEAGGTYSVNDIPDLPVDPSGVTRDFGRTLQFLGAANQIAGEDFGLTFGDKNWLNPNVNWMAAAIQIGIWESLYEGQAQQVDTQQGMSSSVILSTDSGWFTASTSNLGSQGTDFLSKSFDRMATLSPDMALDAGQVKWLQIDGGQDLLVDPVDVPAPAPLLLLLSGLALLLRRGR